MGKNLPELDQVVADLLDANEQAIAVLTGAVSDIVGRHKLRISLESRRSRAQAAEVSPLRDMQLRTALKVLKSK